MVPEAAKIMLDQSIQILFRIKIFIYFLEQ